MHAMGDDHGMSINDESHRKSSPPWSAQESGDPVAPRALSMRNGAAHTRLSGQPLQRHHPHRRI